MVNLSNKKTLNKSSIILYDNIHFLWEDFVEHDSNIRYHVLQNLFHGITTLL